MATARLGDDALAQRPAVSYHHQAGFKIAGLSAARLGRRVRKCTNLLHGGKSAAGTAASAGLPTASHPS